VREREGVIGFVAVKQSERECEDNYRDVELVMFVIFTRECSIEVNYMTSCNVLNCIMFGR
jgi:hypothetical protein